MQSALRLVIPANSKEHRGDSETEWSGQKYRNPILIDPSLLFSTFVYFASFFQCYFLEVLTRKNEGTTVWAQREAFKSLGNTGNIEEAQILGLLKTLPGTNTVDIEESQILGHLKASEILAILKRPRFWAS